MGCSEDTIDDTGLGSITGKVVKVGSNEPVENARISTNPASSTVFTDKNGEFSLNDIPVDDYSVEARKENLLTQFEGASVMANATVNVIFEMQKKTTANNAPTTPEAIFPEDNAEGVDVPVTLSWSSADPDEDELIYSLEIRNNKDQEILAVQEISDTTYTVEGLLPNTRYFWQVSVSDGANPDVLSPLYAFTTMETLDQRVLFTRIVEGNNVIFSSDLEGNETQLTSASNNSFRPRKNNASNRIAFLRSVGAQTHLFTMDPDGSNKKQVTSAIPVRGFNLEKIDFAWADDGTSLLFPDYGKLYRISATGGGTKLIYQTTDGDFISEIAVGESDNTIALVTNNSNGYDADLFTIDFGGNVQKQILDNITGAVGGLDLSVTGDLILYSHDASGFESESYRRLDSRIFLYNFSTGETIDLSSGKENGTNDLDPRFSPNEAEVIFVNSSNDEISRKDIYTISIQQNQENRSRAMLIQNAAMPDWE